MNSINRFQRRVKKFSSTNSTYICRKSLKNKRKNRTSPPLQTYSICIWRTPSKLWSEQSSTFDQMFKESLAAFYNISICNLKIPSIPRVCNISRAIGIIQQKTHFMLWITSKNPKHISPISLFHCDQIIIFIIVRFLKLNCSFSITGNSMSGKFLLRRGGTPDSLFHSRFPLYSLQQMQYRNPTVVVFCWSYS